MKSSFFLLSLFLLSTAHGMSPEKQEEVKWAPTNMSPLFLTNTIQYNYCNYNLERFRGCVAAVDRFVKYVDPKSGIDIVNDEFQIVRDNDFSKRFDNYKAFIVTKRKKLDRISKQYSSRNTQSLIDIFNQQLKIKGTLKPHEIAIPVNEFNAVLYDPFKTYEPIDRYNGLYRITLQPSMGVEVTLKKDKLRVDKVVVNSPSFDAGIKTDDLLIKANGKDITLKNEEEVDKFFHFENGQIVRFTVQREGKTFEADIKFTYDKFPPVVDKKIQYEGKEYTYLHMNDIPSDLEPEVTCRIFQRILKKFNDETDGMILDLRDNVGGYGDVAACITSGFIGEGIHIYTENDILGESLDKKVTDFPKVFTKPLTIIVNENTASSGEILAGALRFQGRGYVVGNRTFGKGIGQIVENFPGATGDLAKLEIHFTSLMVQYPDGTSHQSVGIVPDYKVFYHGAQETQEEKSVMRMEDYAVYPLKFKTGTFHQAKAVLPRLAPVCTAMVNVRSKFNKLADTDWKKDMQLQYALSVLNCSK